jgi:hypothetical protein
MRYSPALGRALRTTPTPVPELSGFSAARAAADRSTAQPPTRSAHGVGLAS